MNRFFLFLALLSAGCCVKYTFKGANLPKEVKTFSVSYIENKASLVAPQLSNVLTEKLKNKLTNETSLKSVTGKGDLQFSGYISSYQVTNAAQQGNNTVAANRLTITVDITCTNLQDTMLNFKQQFSNFGDFPGTQPLNAVEGKLINDISDLLVQEIFNKAVINW
jgi:hypothetical protein